VSEIAKIVIGLRRKTGLKLSDPVKIGTVIATVERRRIAQRIRSRPSRKIR